MLPDNWSALPLGLLLASLKYGTSKRSEYGIAGTPVLRIPNVSGPNFDATDLKYAPLDAGEASDLALRSGDLLMIRSNGSVELVGKTMLVPTVANDMAYAGYLMRLRLDRVLADPSYIELVLASPSLRRQIELPARSASGVHNINSTEVRSLVVPLPPLAEQEEIVRRVQQLLDGGAAVAARATRSMTALQAAGDGILLRAFVGGFGSSSNQAVSPEDSHANA